MEDKFANHTYNPEIRFRGYTDDWEQRKLGELCNITTGKLDANAMVSDGQYDFYTSGIDVFKIDVAAFEGPAITIAGNGASVGYMHLADGKFNAYQRTYVLTDFLADRQFLNVAIGNELPDKIQEEVRGSGIPYIVLNMLTDLAIPFPSHEEQYAIGVYFQQLDNLITLHQRKCDMLKNLKASMLTKMFPKEGESVPEIRFKGFTEPWKQRKLGDVIDDMYNGQTPSRNKSKYWNGTIKWLSSGELNRGTVYDSIETITEEGQKAANLKIVAKGTFVMAITGLEAAGTRGNCALLGFDTTLNQSCMALFPKQEMLTSEFLFQWYRKVGEEYGINYTQGTKQQSYNAELIKILLISLPSVVEQRKISSYLSHLDYLITLHQRKYEKLLDVKKAFLEKMIGGDN